MPLTAVARPQLAFSARNQVRVTEPGVYSGAVDAFAYQLQRRRPIDAGFVNVGATSASATFDVTGLGRGDWRVTEAATGGGVTVTQVAVAADGATFVSNVAYGGLRTLALRQFSCDEPTGSVAIDTGPAASNGAYSSGMVTTAGRHGAARTLSSGQSLTAPQTGTWGAAESSLTFACWVRWQGSQNANLRSVFRGTSGELLIAPVTGPPSGVLGLQPFVFNSGVNYPIGAPVVLTDSQWVHLALTARNGLGENTRLYLNGKFHGASPHVAWASALTGLLTIGNGSPSQPNRFVGSAIDDVVILRREVGVDGVLRLMEGPVALHAALSAGATAAPGPVAAAVATAGASAACVFPYSTGGLG